MARLGSDTGLFAPSVANLKSASTLALDNDCASASGTVRFGERDGQAGIDPRSTSPTVNRRSTTVVIR